MSHPTRGQLRARLLGASVLALASGCPDPSEPRVTEGESLRIGRVHLVLEPSDDVIAPDPGPDTADDQLELTARFAFVRGLDEDFVRARIGVPLLAQDALRAAECVPSDQLTFDAPEPDDGGLEIRELLLVDAGDLSIRVGDATYDVPLSLVPDLLPYMSGVEYLHEGDLFGLGSTATPAVNVTAKGSLTDDLPPFSIDAALPPALGLRASEADLDEQDKGALVLRWNSSGNSDDLVTMRLLPLVGSEPAGEEITCVLADKGAARIDIGRLQLLGLPRQTEGVRVTASRNAVTSFDAGDFTNAEFVVERRDRLYVPLTPRR